MIRVMEMLYDSDGIKAVQNAVTMKAFMNEIKDWNYAINSDPYNLFYKVCREFWKFFFVEFPDDEALSKVDEY